MARPETSLRDLIGEQFGPYTLVRRLGIGGMAETFVAVRRGPAGFEQRVCVKLVLPFFQRDKNFVELFHREAKLAAKLRHSNVVGVIDFGEIEGRSYMALELIDGCDLQRLLDAQDRTRLPYELVALIGLDLAAALEHAHDPASRAAGESSGSIPQPIVHRDISPSNVLVSRQGEVLLTDFGVAKAISGTATKQSAIKGKIPYMSPEQLRGDPVDGRSDLFALGVVMFESLAGQRPFDGASDPATILRALKGDHPSLRTLAPETPSEMCDAIERLIMPNVDDRPQSAAELLEALDPFTPPRRVRRELGEKVQEIPDFSESLAPDADDRSEKEGYVGLSDGGSGVSKTAPAGNGDADTRAATRPPQGVAESKSRSQRRRVGLVLVLAIAAAAGAAWALGGRGTDPTPVAIEPPTQAVNADAQEEEDPAPPAGSAETVAPTEEASAAAPSPAKPRPKPEPAVVKPAELSVIAVPWGTIWINGRSAGASPLKKLTLKPGTLRHRRGTGSEPVGQAHGAPSRGAAPDGRVRPDGVTTGGQPTTWSCTVSAPCSERAAGAGMYSCALGTSASSASGTALRIKACQASFGAGTFSLSSTNTRRASEGR